MAASLIVFWDDYDMSTSWRDFTAQGHFMNHDPAIGRTLYGAEVMVAPDRQGQGIGAMLYAARRAIARQFALLLSVLERGCGATDTGRHDEPP